MILSARNLRCTALLALWLNGILLPAQAQDVAGYQASARQLLTRLDDDAAAAGSVRDSAILNINSRASIGALTRAVAVLESYIGSHPEDLVAKMYYGYGQLFMASDFLKNKNYFRAAELSKRGFFFIDEAAESDENNWRLRFLRARMDAFVPEVNGRCVVALKDIAFLQEKPQAVSPELLPFITLMQGRALTTCKREEEAQAAWQRLQQAGEAGTLLLNFRASNETPFLTPEEIKAVLQPMLGAQS